MPPPPPASAPGRPDPACPQATASQRAGPHQPLCLQRHTRRPPRRAAVHRHPVPTAATPRRTLGPGRMAAAHPGTTLSPKAPAAVHSCHQRVCRQPGGGLGAAPPQHLPGAVAAHRLHVWGPGPVPRPRHSCCHGRPPLSAELASCPLPSHAVSRTRAEGCGAALRPGGASNPRGRCCRASSTAASTRRGSWSWNGLRWRQRRSRSHQTPSPGCSGCWPLAEQSASRRRTLRRLRQAQGTSAGCGGCGTAAAPWGTAL